MRHLVTAFLIAAGLVHLLPVSGALGAEALVRLYGVPLTDPNLLILMRHRAVLFGLLGLFFLWAARRPALQAAAWGAGLVSVGSFVGLAAITPGHNAAVARIVTVDAGLLAGLVVGAVVQALAHRRAARASAQATGDTARSGDSARR